MSFSPSGIVHIVDDDESVRDSTIALLKAAGLTSRSYASGDAFLRDFDDFAGGCILLDLHMPGLSGIHVLDSLRARGNKVPVILFSGRADATNEALIRKSGAAARLAKPAMPAELIGMVRRMLAESDANQALSGGAVQDGTGP